MQTFIAFTGLANAIACLFLGFLVLTKDRKKTVHRLYFLMSTAISIWSFSYFFWLRQFTDGTLALFWARILTIGSMFIPTFHLHWLVAYLETMKKSRPILIYFYLQTLFFLCFSFSPLMVNSVGPFRDIFAFWPKPGLLYHFFLLNFLLSLSYSSYLLISQYRKTQGMAKLKIKYLLFASLIAYVSGSSNFPLWYNIPVIPLFNGFFILFPAIIAYSIIKHQLMDIRLVMKRSTIWVASVGTALLYLTGARYLAFRFLPAAGFWFDTGLVLTSILIYPAIKNFYSKLANKYFFSSLYNLQDLVAKLSEKISSTLGLNEIYEFIYESFRSAFYPKSFAVLLWEKTNQRFLLKYSAGLAAADQAELPGNLANLNSLARQQKIIFVDELEALNDPAIRKISSTLRKLHIYLLLPLFFEEEIMGLLILGEKESQEIYNDEDSAVFNLTAAQIATAIKNALLHEDSLRYAESLAAEKNKISSILANFIDPVIFIDQQRCLSLFNPAAKDVFGIEKDDIGKNINDIDYKTAVLKSIILTENENQPKEIFTEQNGDQKYYKALSTKVLNEKKEAIGILKLFYDLTKEKELDKTKSGFVAVAAHQLRTPLTATKWALDMLLNGEAGKIKTEQRSYIEAGLANNERMITIVNDLLIASRIEEGYLRLDLSECDIEKIVDELIRKNKINAQTDFTKNLPLILADKENLTMAIENILSNAADYSPNKEPVHIKAALDDNLLLLSITDNGIGVPEKDKKKLFSKFFRASNAIKTQPDGSGLGLFIAKGIVKAHGGDFLFNSQENKGTTVTLKLPLAPKT